MGPRLPVPACHDVWLPSFTPCHLSVQKEHGQALTALWAVGPGQGPDHSPPSHFCFGAGEGGAGLGQRGQCLAWLLLTVGVRRAPASPGAEGPSEFTTWRDDLVTWLALRPPPKSKEPLPGALAEQVAKASSGLACCPVLILIPS